MADTSGSAFDLCSLISQNNVHSLHTTLTHADKRLIVWTRLSEQNATWILNISDGVDVWKLELDEGQLQAHRELAEVEKYESYFSKFRSELQSGNISVAQLASKMTLTVGSGLLPLIYDLYEAKASEKKAEMQTVLFRLVDQATELSRQLKVANESLERLKAQKDSTVTAGPSILDTLPRKSQAPVMKRKQGHSLINPSSRNLSQEGSFHMSILTGNQSLDIYKCSDANCQFMCSLSNKRYHCPLCDNKPQKPGRMRGHFTKMHSGKQLVQYGRFRMLRCKLKCTRANGRLTENSHYHCCLCGRVLLRKVHLYCHLQAHSYGAADDVDEDAMEDVKDDDEPDDDADVDDDEGGHVDTPAHMAESGIASSQPDNVVALTDGTQVVYVQSIQGGETLAVVPVDGHHDNMQLSQAQQNQLSPAVTTSADLSAQLQVLTSSADTGQMGDLGVVPQEMPQGMGDSQDPSALAEEVEAILNQGEENVADLQIADADEQGQLENLGGSVTSLGQFTGQPHQQRQQPNLDTKLDTQPGVEISEDTAMDTAKDSAVDTEPIEFASPLTHLNMASSTAIPQEPNQLLDVDAMAAASEALPSHRTSLDLSGQLVSSSSQGEAPLQASVLSIASTGGQTPTKADYKFPGLGPEPALPAGGLPTPQQLPRRPKASSQDSLLLLDTNAAPKGDDEVFKFIVSSGGAEQQQAACCCYSHPSVLGDNQALNIDRCKNTDCDCRLYHCPLCTCLPNKPGRIREHFKKIHAEKLIIRYKGLQMLRCKLGCSRPNGNKVFNSHYHCCVCGHICIRKSGLYEHMRVQHGGLTGKNVVPKTEHCCSGDKDVQHKQNCNQTQLEDGSKASPAVQATALLTPTQHESLKPEEADNQSGRSATQAFAGQFQPEGAGNQQAVTVQIPSLGEGQSGTGQQLVIVMPQQTPQGQSVNSVQAQQPIVIVMPQMAPGQVTQPVVVPVANAGS